MFVNGDMLSFFIRNLHLISIFVIQILMLKFNVTNIEKSPSILIIYFLMFQVKLRRSYSTSYCKNRQLLTLVTKDAIFLSL